MNALSRILEQYPDEGFGVLEGFDDALIGVSESRLVYSVDKIIEILETIMTEEEGVAYYEANIHGSVYGPNAPIFVKLIN